MWLAALATHRRSSQIFGASVVALDFDESLVSAARERLASAAIHNVQLVAGPLDRGWVDGAPFGAILINGAVDTRPESLLNNSPMVVGSCAFRGGAGRRKQHCIFELERLSGFAICSTPRRPCSRRLNRRSALCFEGRCAVSLFCATGTKSSTRRSGLIADSALMTIVALMIAAECLEVKLVELAK